MSPTIRHKYKYLLFKELKTDGKHFSFGARNFKLNLSFVV